MNLAYLSARSQIPTLLWDVDPQGSTSWYFPQEKTESFKLSRLIKKKDPIGKLIQRQISLTSILFPQAWECVTRISILTIMAKATTIDHWLALLSEQYSLVILIVHPYFPVSESIFHGGSDIHAHDPHTSPCKP